MIHEYTTKMHKNLDELINVILMIFNVPIELV